MKKDIISLSRWLINKNQTSLLKIQKILFFIRYEELKNKNTKDSYFKDDKNFQAWIYGPVSRESFEFLQPWFNKETELEEYILDSKEEKEIDKIYLKYYEKYNKFTATELVEKSHKNHSWIKARGNLGENDICKEFMIENEDFLKFDE